MFTGEIQISPAYLQNSTYKSFHSDVCEVTSSTFHYKIKTELANIFALLKVSLEMFYQKSADKSIIALIVSVAVTLAIVMGTPMNVKAQNADIDVLKKINNSDISSATYKSMRFITNSTTEICMAVPVGLLAAGFIEDNRQMRLKAVYMLETMAIAEGITFVLKYSVNRDRPYITYPFIVQKSHGGSPSFPSGHTSFAFSMATSLSIAYPKWYVVAPSIIFAASVGYSRMYLGVHYPTDVVAGALVGAGSAIITYKVNNWLHHSRHKYLSVSW